MIELRDHMSRASRPPLSFVEDRDVAEDAWPRTATRGLHRREPLHRQYGWHIERHRLDEIERQALAVWERPLIEIPLHQPVRIVDELAVLGPSDAGNPRRVVEMLDEIEDELLAVAPADEVDFRALKLHELRVQRREDSPERQPHGFVASPDLTRENLGVRITRGRQKAQTDEIRPLSFDLADDNFIRRLRICLIEQN